MKLHRILLCAGLAGTLAGCGGDGSEMSAPTVTPAATSGVPSSATASPTAYTAFVSSLKNSDTAEPLDVSKVTPPTSETAAPLAI